MKVLGTILTVFVVTLESCSLPDSSSRESSGSKISSGQLSVPENRNDPNSRQISISYAYISKTGDKNFPPIVFLQGGPGGSSLSMQNFFANSPLRRNHDIILFDARGTGRSGAYCENAGSKFLELMARDLSVEEEYEGTLEICERCKEELDANKVDLRGYNSMENASDLEALREHLGIDKWILFGGSYGTRLGLTYLREYNAAEAAIFMGLFPPEVNIYEGFVEGLDTSLEYLFSSCQSDTDCNERYPELKSSFQSAIKNLKSQPKTVSYQGEDFIINAQDALLFIHQMLYSRSTIQQVPAFIKAHGSEDIGVIVRSINSTAARLSVINAATYWSVQANEEVQFNGENSIKKELANYPALQPGPAFFASDQRILQQWHSYRSGALENERVVANTPILIVNGLFDPITPISNARNVMEYLPNATLIEFPYDGHGTFNSCFFNLIEGFVTEGYKAPESSCAENGSLNWQ